MGYSKNSKAHLVVKRQLDELLAAKGERQITWVSGDAAKLAYKLREAMTRDEYAPLKSLYVIRVRDNKVVAEPRVALVLPQASLETMNIPEAEDVLEIIGAALKHQKQRMYFENAQLGIGDLHTLYNWCMKNTYYIVLSDDGITLTKHDPGILAWKP